MRIGDLADGMTRGMEGFSASISETFFEPVIRLGVTGLSRAGKTVFITSLVANLLDRGRMPQMRGVSSGAITAAYLKPQPDNTIPRFDYETHLAALTGTEPRWPDSTRAVSELRLSLKVRSGGLGGILGAVTGPRTVHVDIVDYPGEWLLDLALLDKSYEEWSADAFARMDERRGAEGFRAVLAETDITAELDEPTAQALAGAFTEYLQVAREAGFSDCSPGRFLLPGEMAGSPVLTFTPLPKPQRGPARNSLWREFERRYEAYKSEVVKPFFREHFSKIDRQVVLVDALGAIHAGPRAVEDLRRAMTEILGAFRPGRNAWLSSLLVGKKVERILFAATKADHLHHVQHPRLTAIMQALMRDARRRADFAGADTAAMAIASLRATVEEEREHDGDILHCVRGALLETGRQAALYPGELPEDPTVLLEPARAGAEDWLDADYNIMNFAPARLTLKSGDGPPHIRLDKAADFLLGDRLR